MRTALLFMATRRGTKYQVQISGLNEARKITHAQWQDFISRRLIRQIGKHLAVLAEGVRAFTLPDGQFDLDFAPSYHVRNSWQSWEIAWLFAINGRMPASVAVLGLFQRQQWVEQERQTDIDNEAAMWRISRAKAPELSR